MRINSFYFSIIFFLINNINSEKEIKFNLYYLKEGTTFSFKIENFAKFYIDNKYTTNLLMGEPPQKIYAFLNPELSAFYLTNATNFCPTKNYYNYELSKSYNLVEKIENKYYTTYRVSDSILFENDNNSFDKDDKIAKFKNFELFSFCELNQPICAIFGTKLVSSGEEIKESFLNSLHSNDNIKSYYFSYEIKSDHNNDLKFIFDIDIKGNEEGYSFIKTSSYKSGNKYYLAWGLNFDSVQINNNINIVKSNQTRAEFNINLGCLIGPPSFHEILHQFFQKNNIIESRIIYSNEYYIYAFEDEYYKILQNFTLEFYHKDLNYHFILDYKDLFISKADKIYCLIVLNYKDRDYWKFGLPFLKKYKFIYNQDTKFMGFLNENKKTTKEKSDTSKNKNNYFKIKSKIIIIVLLCFFFILIGMIFFGILIGKKMYKARKKKTNELLELYDYNSKTEQNL